MSVQNEPFVLSFSHYHYCTVALSTDVGTWNSLYYYYAYYCYLLLLPISLV